MRERVRKRAVESRLSKETLVSLCKEAVKLVFIECVVYVVLLANERAKIRI